MCVPLIKKPLRDRFSVSTNSPMILREITVLVKKYCHDSFISFGNKMGLKSLDNFIAFVCGSVSDIKISMLRRICSISCIVMAYFKTKKITEQLYGSWINHFDSKTESIAGSNRSSLWDSSFDSNTALSVNKSSEIVYIHSKGKDTTKRNIKQEINTKLWMNSGNPLTDNAEGNPEPSRKYTFGRCRDYWRGKVLLITSKSVQLVREDIVRSLQKCKEYGRNVHALLNSRVTLMENQDVTTSKTIWQGNMTTNNRRKHGKLTGITA